MKKLIVRLIAGALISLILSLVPVTAQQTTPVAGTSPATAEAAAELRRKTFETVWQTINDKHFDPNFNGVDWKGVHTKYAPLVEAVKNDAELYGVLTNMLGELKESHFAIIPPALIDDTGDTK